MLKSLEELVNIIRARKNASPEKSYTNKLLNDKTGSYFTILYGILIIEPSDNRWMVPKSKYPL